jgi:hypothetical protein
MINYLIENLIFSAISKRKIPYREILQFSFSNHKNSFVFIENVFKDGNGNLKIFLANSALLVLEFIFINSLLLKDRKKYSEASKLFTPFF